MSRDEDKLIRQLSLLSFLLSRPRPFSAREIRESVEGYSDMSDETFTRRFYGDRSDLEKIGIQVRAIGEGESAEAQTYCLLEEDYRLPSVEFTPEERQTLALALTTLEGRFAYARPLRLALTAITAGQPNPFRDEQEHLPVALAPDEDAQRAGKQLARLEQAAARGKTVSFSYPAAGGESERRTFDPYSLFLIQGRWYTVGFDHARQAIRTFRVARMEGSVRFVTEKARDFVVPADYDPAQYGARPPWLIGPVRGSALVKVDDDLSWWASRLEPHVRPAGEDDDGCTIFEIPYADEEILLSWTVNLGGCGELLGPAELREELYRRLEQVRSAHEGPGSPPPLSQGRSRRRPTPAAQATSEPIPPEHLPRALSLLQYLVAEERTDPVTWGALKDDLGLSRQEVEHDLSLLNLMNFGGGTYAIWAEADDEGVKVTPDVMASTFIHPARLSPLMARALLLAIDLLGDALGAAGAQALLSAREKIAGLMGNGAGSGEIPVLVDDFMPAAQDVMVALNQGIRDNRIVEIDYFTPTRGELTSRRIEPYLLFRSRDGWYVEAYCLKAAGQRTFRVELIRAARSTGEVFDRREEMDLSLRRAGMVFSPENAAGWATLRFDPRWRSYLEDRGIEFEVLPDEALAARLPYLDERWAAREVLKFLGGAVLEEPAGIRVRIRDLAASLICRYASVDQPPKPQENRP